MLDSKTTLDNLYDIAYENDINVYEFPLNPIKSMSIPGAIGIDKNQIKSQREEKERLAHEIGHCMKHAFYTGSSPFELREQKEYKADKWAIKTLIPFNQLLSAIEQGINETWSLAEHFSVTESFIKKTLNLYEENLINLRLDKEV